VAQRWWVWSRAAAGIVVAVVTKGKKNPPLYDFGVDSHTLTEVVKGSERHHGVLQALFKRLTDPALASFIHEGPSHPIPVKLHQQIHRELNEVLRQNGFLERFGQPRVSLTPADFKKALQVIEKFYAQQASKHPSVNAFPQLKENVRNLRRTLEAAGLL
jgi:hypothetical protein